MAVVLRGTIGGCRRTGTGAGAGALTTWFAAGVSCAATMTPAPGSTAVAGMVWFATNVRAGARRPLGRC